MIFFFDKFLKGFSIIRKTWLLRNLTNLFFIDFPILNYTFLDTPNEKLALFINTFPWRKNVYEVFYYHPQNGVKKQSIIPIYQFTHSKFPSTLIDRPSYKSFYLLNNKHFLEKRSTICHLKRNFTNEFPWISISLKVYLPEK
jgi:hypothetical protein